MCSAGPHQPFAGVHFHTVRPRWTTTATTTDHDFLRSFPFSPLQNACLSVRVPRATREAEVGDLPLSTPTGSYSSAGGSTPGNRSFSIVLDPERVAVLGIVWEEWHPFRVRGFLSPLLPRAALCLPWAIELQPFRLPESFATFRRQLDGFWRVCDIKSISLLCSHYCADGLDKMACHSDGLC